MSSVIMRHLLLLRLLIPTLCILFHPSLHAQAGSGPLTLSAGENLQLASAGAANTSANGAVQSLVPAGIWQLPASASHLLWVELDSGRLNILEKASSGNLHIRQQVPVSIGKQGYGKTREGDKRTPVGVYRMTSFLTDAQLDDFYGTGAYTLNYPNPLDAIRGFTGHGIWLHGLPKGVAQRPLLDSDGCVVIDNTSLQKLDQRIVAGETYIIMTSGGIDWVSKQRQDRQRQSLLSALENWKQAWEDRDNSAYLGFYAEDFTDLDRNKAEWAAYKKRVNNSKEFIDLNFSDISIIADPEQRDLVTVRYFQDYKSDNYVWSGWKEQLWQRTEAGWRIRYEGNG